MATPPFSPNTSVPADDDFIRLYPVQERTFRDVMNSWLAYEHDATTGRHKIPTDTTANLAALNYATGSMRYDTTDNTFQVTASAGSTWNIVSIVPGFQFLIRSAAGTAPRGWTKVTLGSNYAIVASDSATASIDGGSTDFTTVFGSRTISQANLPNVNFTVSGTAAASGTHNHGGATGGISADHTHTFSATTSTDGNHQHQAENGQPFLTDGTGDFSQDSSGDEFAYTNSTNTTGQHAHSVSGTTSGVSSNHTHSISSDGSHTHTVTGTAASGGSGTGMDFSVLRLGHTLCTKASPA